MNDVVERVDDVDLAHSQAVIEDVRWNVIHPGRRLEKSIELDCAPGGPRPGDLIGWVVEGTILEGLPEAGPEATVIRFFGNWKWEFDSVSDEDWRVKVQSIIKSRIEALYHNGTIRYGSW